MLLDTREARIFPKGCKSGRIPGKIVTSTSKRRKARVNIQILHFQVVYVFNF